MSGGLTMDHTFLPRSIWTGDSKFLQHPVDLYTSVVVTRSIPAGTCFGPCVLQNTFYDTIAFIAQKSCDKRAKSYMFRVDPEAMRNSALVLSWLRLVQAARNGEEQNTEAFLKAGQLYVRTIRDIRQEEELLVWYDQELSHLLGFTDLTRGSREEFKCGRCNQVFKNEYPFLAHCRFLCTQVKSDTWSREAYEHKHVEIKRQHRVTDFHNIARDLEHKKSGSNEDAEIFPKRRKYEETLYPKGRKTVLLEKTNISNDDNITQLSKGHDEAAGDASSSAGKLKADKIKPDHLGCKNDVFTEQREAKETFTHGRETDARSETGESSGVHLSSSSAFSLVLSNSQGEQKSAFCKPSKRTSPIDPQTHLSGASTAPSSRLEAMTDAFTSRTVMGYNNMMASSILSGDLQTVPSPVSLNNSFHYAPEHWSRNIGVQLQTTSSLTILPPTFTSFGVSVQNWCAKCNLSFRMTSDLVFHMRSHHKKEFAAESQVRRRREEKLTCPICHEYFRERHHLSRHMTSHN
ncbi:PR domain zinc finger protein 8 [Larimichthys crocea]|uniref:PR domain zinc finger protein 8 n=1 Tax=Larimichthys crocea TaxID=215358 RepID=A0A6G0HN53_LARCR|nr:PR domain zinc finger protein 8 [Larimichthys crocea]KAE8280600.1 PR domain zinc finger protein 8 [Larimichthys crocea]